MKTIAFATLGLALAAPALAQSAPPAPPASPAMQDGQPQVRVYDMRRGGEGRRDRFGDISPEGRAILREAMRPDGDTDRAAVRAARDRVQAVLMAERLDVAALRRAMDEENRLVDAMRDRRRAATLEAVQKLSLADRRAFAQSAAMGRERMDVRVMRFRRGPDGQMRMEQGVPAMPVPPAAPGA